MSLLAASRAVAVPSLGVIVVSGRVGPSVLASYRERTVSAAGIPEITRSPLGLASQAFRRRLSKLPGTQQCLARPTLVRRYPPM